MDGKSSATTTEKKGNIAAAMAGQQKQEELERQRRRRASPRRIGIFGLSANPPTNELGHLGVVRAFVNLFDELWVVPVYVHPFSSKRKKLEAFEHRIAMCRMCFERYGGGNVRVASGEVASGEDENEEDLYNRVKVIDIEKKLVDAAVAKEQASRSSPASGTNGCSDAPAGAGDLNTQSERDPGRSPGPSDDASTASETGAGGSSVYRMGTIDVLESLKASNPDVVEWSLIVGMDAYKDLIAGLWKDGDRLRAGCNLVVVPRQFDMDSVDSSYDQDSANDGEQRNSFQLRARQRGSMYESGFGGGGVGRGALLLPVPGLTAISSTKVREYGVGQEEELRKSVVREVADYIVENKLYGFRRAADAEDAPGAI